MLSVMRGAEIDSDKPGLKIRMQAAEWLSDRGFGKPSQFVEFTHREHDPLDDATYDDLRLIAADLQRQRAVLVEQRALEEPATNVIEGDGKVLG